MSGPFYNAIKGTTAGTPGTGAFTPNAASSGFRAWSTVPTGWWGLVRYEDGSNWELSYSYWNGTTLSRSATQEVDSSSGSLISLTSAATAALVVDAVRTGVFTGIPVRQIIPTSNSTTTTAIGLAAATVTGTASAAALASTNQLTETIRVNTASATTANAQCGYTHAAALAAVSTSAGRGGFLFQTQFGATGLPTGPRLFCGMTASTFVGQAIEPSAFTANYAVFAKDSGDTNIQFLTNSNAGSGTKIDTGMVLAINALYSAYVWNLPGSSNCYGMLVRHDTGEIFYTATSTDVPATGALVYPQLLAGLSATTGTAFTLSYAGYAVRSGGV
jgi:hypothetical protein